MVLWKGLTYSEISSNTQRHLIHRARVSVILKTKGTDHRVISPGTEGGCLGGARGSLLMMKAFYKPCTQHDGSEEHKANGRNRNFNTVCYKGRGTSPSQKHQRRLPSGGGRSKNPMGHHGQAGWSEDTSEQRHRLEGALGM